MGGKRLVVTVHGIRTFGGWQERLESLLATQAAANGQTLDVIHYKYGYFSAFAFVSILMRWLTVRRFRREFRQLADRGWERIDIVAHSFGTYVVGKALLSLGDSCPPIHTVVLAGSVLPSRFPWRELVPRCVQRVVNECGTRDHILLLSQALPLLGMAGRIGFEGMTGSALRNRFFDLGHSGYFLENGAPSLFMERNWLPLLAGTTDEVPPVDERKLDWKSGIQAFLLNNANPLKVAAYALAAAALLLFVPPFVSRQFALNAVTLERGYVATTDDGEVKLYFDGGAVPSSSIRRLNDIGPVHIIDLAKTKITDVDVSALPRSDTLRHLDLSGTAITGAALVNLERFPRLEELHLEETNIRSLSGLPSTLSRLRTLDIDSLAIGDQDLAFLAPLTALQDIDLAWNQIRGPGLRHLAGHTHLRKLDLIDNSIDDQGLESLVVLRSLVVLDLEANPIEGGGLRHLSGLRELEELDISFTQVDDSGLAHLPLLPKLRSITLTSNTKLTGSTLSTLTALPSLEELWMKDTHVGTESTVHIAGMKKLKVLALPATKIGRGALAPIGRVASLQQLYLGAVEIVDQDLRDLTGLTRLELLYLPGNPQLTDEALVPIAALRALKEVNLERTSTTRAGRDNLLRTQPGLKVIF